MARCDYASDALVVGRNYDDSDAFALLKDDVAVTVCQMVVVPRNLALWLRGVGGHGLGPGRYGALPDSSRLMCIQ